MAFKIRALGALNSTGVLGGLLGGNNMNCCTSEDHLINRYEAAQQARIAELETEVKLRDSNIYTDSKIADVYEKLNTKIGGVEAQLCQQSVVNAQVTANLACLQNTVATLTGLTKTVIPITSVCPEPMAKLNSWTAPTAGA